MQTVILCWLWHPKRASDRAKQYICWKKSFVQSPRTYFFLLICNEGKAQVEKDFFRHIGSTPSNNGIYLWYYCSLHFAAEKSCSSDHGCEHVCFQGSSNEATCTCYANYELDSNEKNCTGKLLIFFFNLKKLVVDRSQCFFWNENQRKNVYEPFEC